MNEIKTNIYRCMWSLCSESLQLCFRAPIHKGTFVSKFSFMPLTTSQAGFYMHVFPDPNLVEALMKFKDIKCICFFTPLHQWQLQLEVSCFRVVHPSRSSEGDMSGTPWGSFFTFWHKDELIRFWWPKVSGLTSVPILWIWLTGRGTQLWSSNSSFYMYFLGKWQLSLYCHDPSE